MKETINAKLVAIQDGVYTNYVFKNLDSKDDLNNKYITVTRCPNWQYSDRLFIGDCGFLEYEFVEAGEKYIDAFSGTEEQYKYTANYFINFIKSSEHNNTKEFNF